MYLDQTVAPAGTPITLDEVKAHLRVDTTDEDSFIGNLISTAVEHLEGKKGRSGLVGRALLPQTFVYKIDGFPCPQRGDNGRLMPGYIEPPMPPLRSVTSIQYYDTNGAQQTLDPAAYIVETAHLVGRIRIPATTSWPATLADENVVTITFVAGYADATDVPRALKQAMLLLIGHWYTTREIPGDAHYGYAFAIDTLLNQHRVMGF